LELKKIVLLKQLEKRLAIFTHNKAICE
jgi:hypothetical protein